MRYIAMVLCLLGVDFGIKEFIEKNKELGSEEYKAKNTLIIRKHHNKGMALNFLENKQHLVAILSLILSVVVMILLLFSLGTKGNALLRTGLTFLLGGAFGNTYDRLKRKYVVDYVSFNVPFKELRNIIFNVADFFIMIGAMLTVIGLK